MLRTQVVKLARASNLQATRRFSVVAARAAEGDTGATRSGGAATGDAFNKREAASESKYIKEKEVEALRSLKERLKTQQEHLDKLNTHIKDLEKGQQK